jgi:predicted metal-dependent HD superfamily phosphohydrolase
LKQKRNISKLKSIIQQLYKENLKSDLTYHGFHHVLDVLNACNAHIKRDSIPHEKAYLLRTAALLHDTGILWTYSNHETKGIEYSKKLLPTLDYNDKEIDIVCNLIRATELPQSPKNELEEIICDADLDYLGTNSFYTVGGTLFKEFIAYDVVSNEEEWDKLQVRFLEKHHYFTAFCKANREPKKQERIKEIKAKWGW